MKIVDKIKDSVSSIRDFFKRRNQKWLESGEEVAKTSEQEVEYSQAEKLMKEQKSEFDASVEVDLEQNPIQVTTWPTVYYKGKKLPASVYLQDVIEQGNAEYLEENKYAITTENLSPENAYHLLEKVVSRTVDSIGLLVMDTQEQHNYEQAGRRIRSEGSLANFLMKNGKSDKAIEKLDNLLLSQIDYYHELMAREEAIEEKE